MGIQRQGALQVRVPLGVRPAFVVIAGAQRPHHGRTRLFAYSLFAQGEHLRVVVAIVGAVYGFHQAGHAEFRNQGSAGYRAKAPVSWRQP